ncbi:MAG: helix-turn-helix transcriptional regulator [Clostridia bacterium]|nr:helix-turn-helix transcriptional regulator [Clostridia bacterium]
MSTMSNIIKEKRNALGITQKELAEKLSISDKTVSRWESGNQFPDAILLPDLAEALDISIGELYGIKTETLQYAPELKQLPHLLNFLQR